MFSQRKRFYQKKSFYGMVFVFLLAFGVWFNAGLSDNTKGDARDSAISVDERVASDASEKKDKPQNNPENEYSYGSFAADGNDVDGNGDNTEAAQGDLAPSGETPAEPYYLLKEEDGYIKLYSVDEAGEMQLVRTTDIAFSLLSETDQKLFEQGIIKQTKDDLIDLLENFES